MTSKSTPRKKMGWGMRSLLVLGAVGSVATALLVIAQLWPTDLAAASAEFPPINDTSGRRIVEEGCGLTETPSDDGCATILSEFIEEEIRFPSSIAEKGLAELAGTLSIPTQEGLGPRPAVVLVHGSGPNPRNTPSPGDLLVHHDEPFEVFPTLAAHLARQGLIVLRYDKRTCGPCYPGRDLDDFTATFSFRDFVTDAKDALDYLASRPEVDSRALVVAGHSQGGQLSYYIAQGDSRVAAVMMLAGHIEPFDVVASEQLDRLIELRERQFDYSARMNLWVGKMFTSNFEFLECSRVVRSGNFDPQASCTGVRYVAWDEYLRMGDQAPDVIRSLRCPLFAIQGSLDRNINPREVPRIRTLMEGKDAEFHYVPGVIHDLTNAFADGPLAFDPDVLARIDRFLASVKPGSRASSSD